MCCDVALRVLERVEAERGGAPPVFWMDLAGAWAIDGRIEPDLSNTLAFRRARRHVALILGGIGLS